MRVLHRDVKGSTTAIVTLQSSLSLAAISLAFKGLLPGIASSRDRHSHVLLYPSLRRDHHFGQHSFSAAPYCFQAHTYVSLLCDAIPSCAGGASLI